MADVNRIPYESLPNWRISLDRAWRTASVRRQFETETGLSPLPSGDDNALRNAMSGQTAQYQDRFVIWATRHFGLAELAPAVIRERIALGA
jgi:hypothetical protein